MNIIGRESKQFRREVWINSSEKKISVFEPKERFRKKAWLGRKGRRKQRKKQQGEVWERERETGNKMAYELLILRKEWDENEANKIKTIVNRQKNENQEGRKWKRT